MSKSGSRSFNSMANVTAEDLIQTLADSKKVIDAFNNEVENLPKITDDVKVDIDTWIKTQLSDIQSVERESIINNPKFIKIIENITGLHNDYLRVVSIKNQIVDLTNVGQVDPVSVGTQVPESLDIPWDKIKNTYIDLMSTPRQVGDSITVRATLYEDKSEKDKTTATFEVAQYGWYADLSPAVVLVKPTQFVGAYDGFRFAPTLSWMNHYMPGLMILLGMTIAFVVFNPASVFIVLLRIFRRIKQFKLVLV